MNFLNLGGAYGRGAVAEMIPLERNAGFLCVCWSADTFFSPAVMSPPGEETNKVWI